MQPQLPQAQVFGQPQLQYMPITIVGPQMHPVTVHARVIAPGEMIHNPGREAIWVVDPATGRPVVTKMKSTPSPLAWVLCVLCPACCCCALCCLREIHHYLPSGQLVGIQRS